jgi:uncharacterized iron-regulated protein
MREPRLFFAEILSARFIWTAGVLAVILGWGCATAPKTLWMKDMKRSFSAGEIVSGRAGQAVSLDEMMADLETVQVVYVGERHTDPLHHRIQLEILRRLARVHPGLSVGMEMFDHTYQPVLDRWSRGELDWQKFLEQTHWYANWRYRASLYEGILKFVKQQHLPLIGLNIPFSIPPKISIGGIDSLNAYEKKQLPASIDLTNSAHRKYVKKVFEGHHIPGRNSFENFYEAQCAWEDGMADAIAKHLGTRPMVVLLGDGHIIYKFGVPERAFKRTGATYRTVYLAPAGSSAELAYGDYIWVTSDATADKTLGTEKEDKKDRKKST